MASGIREILELVFRSSDKARFIFFHSSPIFNCINIFLLQHSLPIQNLRSLAKSALETLPPSSNQKAKQDLAKSRLNKI